MLFRLLKESLGRRKGRVALALLAVVAGASMATALLGLSTDILNRMSRELRSYGANILMTTHSDTIPLEVAGVSYLASGAPTYMDVADLPKIKTIFWRNNIVGFAPYLGAQVHRGEESVILTGTWFDKEVSIPEGTRLRTGVEGEATAAEKVVFRTGVRAIAPWWEVEGQWPEDEDEEAALIGAALARRWGTQPGDAFSLEHEGKTIPIRVVGILHSGGFEEDQIVVSLPVAQKVLGLPEAVSKVMVSAMTLPKEKLAPDIRNKKPEEMTPKQYEKWYCSPVIDSITTQLKEVIPHSEAKAIRQISESEGSFAYKIQWLIYLITGVALTASTLGVMATVNTSILERRAEIGLMKALGAQDGQIAYLFLVEAATTGLVGGLLGYGLGVILAQFIRQQVFNGGGIVPLSILPLTLLMALGIALLGTALSVKQATTIDPIALLRGA